MEPLKKCEDKLVRCENVIYTSYLCGLLLFNIIINPRYDSFYMTITIGE